MKKTIMALVMLGFAAWAHAEPGFVQTLPADDFGAAGLKKLTPEELARLEVLVERYKKGIVAEVREQAAASRQELEQKTVVAEAKARDAEEKARDAEQKARLAEAKAQEVAARPPTPPAAPAVTPPAGKKPGWFSALITLNRASEKPEKAEPLLSRLIGEFTGWSGNTIFSLEDGTRWAQQNKVDRYEYTPALHSPAVKITPASMGGFWLEVTGVNRRIRVLPYALPGQE